jgi:hypothetical protein
MRPLWITDPQYGADDQEIRSFGPVLPQSGDFQENRTVTLMDLE